MRMFIAGVLFTLGMELLILAILGLVAGYG